MTTLKNLSGCCCRDSRPRLSIGRRLSGGVVGARSANSGPLISFAAAALDEVTQRRAARYGERVFCRPATTSVYHPILSPLCCRCEIWNDPLELRKIKASSDFCCGAGSLGGKREWARKAFAATKYRDFAGLRSTIADCRGGKSQETA